MHCRACNATMRVSFDEGGELEDTLCNDCKRKTALALRMDERDFEGFWRNANWIKLGGIPDAS